jgi:hypothetical protein
MTDELMTTRDWLDQRYYVERDLQTGRDFVCKTCGERTARPIPHATEAHRDDFRPRPL